MLFSVVLRPLSPRSCCCLSTECTRNRGSPFCQVIVSWSHAHHKTKLQKKNDHEVVNTHKNCVRVCVGVLPPTKWHMRRLILFFGYLTNAHIIFFPFPVLPYFGRILGTSATSGVPCVLSFEALVLSTSSGRMPLRISVGALWIIHILRQLCGPFSKLLKSMCPSRSSHL